MADPDVKALDAASAALHQWHAEVAKVAEAFERRWTMRALRRVNPDLHQRLQEQIDLFHQVKFLNEAPDIEAHGAATCRGWQAAVEALEKAGEPDDAYVLGFDPSTGTRVAVGEKICAAKRVAEIHGEKHVWITPDEVASMFAALQGVEAISAIKREFPGAEMVSIYPANPPAEAAE